MKALILPAAVAVALPALAAEDDSTSSGAMAAPPQAAQRQAPAERKAPSEQVASDGVSKDVTLEAAPAAADPEKNALRFESWAREAEDQPYETEAQWKARAR